MVRGSFVNAGLHGDPGPGGRLGGLALDAGLSWNVGGVGARLVGFGGQIAQDDGTRIGGLAGAGPYVNLGRLGVLPHGVLDLRLGYTFFGAFGRDSRGKAVALAPHGPAAFLDLVVLARTFSGQALHAFGAHIFYQAVVHDFRGVLARMSLLGVGLSYWFD